MGFSAPKVVPPDLPDALLTRPLLDRRVRNALARQVCVVVAPAGFGKTTAVGMATDAPRPPAWYHLDGSDRTLSRFVPGLVDALRVRVPDLAPGPLVAAAGRLGPEAAANERARALATAGAIAEALRAAARDDLVLVLDDLHELEGADGALALVEALCRQGVCHVVLLSRSPVPFPLERLRGQGRMAELGPADLAFDEDEAAELLAMVCGPDARALAGRVTALTGGWPVGVRLAAEALARATPDTRDDVLERLSGARGTLQRYLVIEVLGEESPATRALLEVLAALPEASLELCAALGLREAALRLGDLGERGLFLQPGSRPGWVRATPLVREVVGGGLDASSVRRIREDALEWLEAEGPAPQAIDVAVTLDDPATLRRVVERHGPAALASGRIDLVIAACDRLPPRERTVAVEQLHGEALQVIGRWDEALHHFGLAGDEAPALPAGLAWREGMIHYFRGALPDALAVFARGVRDGSAPADEAMLLAWESAAHWRRGEVAAAAAAAEASHALAAEAHDDAGLASAHTALAMVAASRGDRRANDAHYLQALEHAEAAGDALQTIRIRTNRSSFFLDEGAFADALAEAEAAVALADLTGYATFHSLALVNRAEALLLLGRLDEAHADMRAAEAIEQRLRSMDVRYPLLRLGDLYRLRGDRSLARTAYAEAVRLSDAALDRQSLVPALAGLARIHCEDDPPKALALAERAVAEGAGHGHCAALLTLAHVHLAIDGVEAARATAKQAQEEAVERRDRPALAEALEIEALTAGDRIRALQLLDEARAIWQELGSPVGALRALLSAGRVTGGTEGDLLVAHAEQELHALGAHGAVASARMGGPAAPDVEIVSLGGFRLLRRGAVVPVTAWQSRKARDLLKLLVARRGRATPREVLMAALWPDESPDRLANRLSVALSTVRGVLDPGKAHPSDHFLRADTDAVSLDLEHVAVDVEGFIVAVERGLELVRAARRDEGIALLEAVEPRYRGDFLEEDLYEDWAQSTREQARALYVSALRVLAEAAAQRGDHDGAVRRHLRLLERDPYDEPAHLALVATLVASGRHGEARRHYATYAARMDELGLEAARFPG